MDQPNQASDTTPAADPAAADAATRAPVTFQPGLPMLLSLVVPGLGQFYEGRRFAGAIWLVTTTIGYIPFVIPGLVLHLLAIVTAGFRKLPDE